ncbi:unnamed protein product [Pieris macdunnoughi]|uniref:Uncharacterized protein n=1 Tax=Pieris macdunnoughi TaxID=345717 RepID=A0A821SXC3_9NEOP|nr:unnamed protein product [Pieris macdunnoughi]
MRLQQSGGRAYCIGVGRGEDVDPAVLPQRLSTSIQTPDVMDIRAKTRAHARFLPQRPHSMDAWLSTGGHAFRRVDVSSC